MKKPASMSVVPPSVILRGVVAAGRGRRPTTSLRYSLQRFVYGAQQPLVAFWGPYHVVLAANDAALRLLPPPVATDGATLRDAWPDLASSVEPLLNAAYAGRPCRLGDEALWVEHPAGGRAEHYTSTFAPVPYPDGSCAGTLWSLTDVSRRVRDASALSTLLDDVDLRVVVVSVPSLRVEWLSPAALRALPRGRTVADPLALVGRPAADVLPAPVTAALPLAARRDAPFAVDAPPSRYVLYTAPRPGATPRVVVVAHTV